MKWHYWVLNLSAGDQPCKEWVAIINELKNVIQGKYIDKIEVAAFSIPQAR